MIPSLKLAQYSKTVIAGEFLTVSSASKNAEKTQVTKLNQEKKKKK